MSTRRIAILIVVLALPLSLWIVLTEAKNDVRAFTATVQRQVRNDDSLLERFFMRYRLPDGDPEEQHTMLDGAYRALQRIEPDEVVNGARDRIKLSDGRERNHRQVILRGRDRSGDPATVRIEWIQDQGRWYIHDYSRD